MALTGAVLAGELLLGLSSLDIQCNLARGGVAGSVIIQAVCTDLCTHADN